jgi:hypothetical protein
MKMDDQRYNMLFDIMKKDCKWRIKGWFYPLSVENRMHCTATQLDCNQENCMPFQFAKFFNRPEVKNV